MASQPPSVQSLQNWEDAFIHYPLPTVRALERDLRKNIDENRSKLRSLVGASYRDLLGTAERIIEMDGQMSTLESGLGDMGRRCDARRLERSGSNWAGMKKRTGGEDESLMAAMVQTKVLQGCLTIVGRVVKGREDALLGAKVLVLARLLAKGIGDSGKAPSVLEELRKKLATLRKRLLAYIERSIVKVGTDKTALASTLCAYALVTSSTPKEVLRHFLQVRFRQLENKADSPADGEVMEMLNLYSRTLLVTKDLFPRRFADALSQLAKVPLFRDPQVFACHELGLDIYSQWIAEDVRSFTPWVRHDQVTSSETNDALASWTKQAHQCLLTGLEEYLDSQTDLSVVVESRHAVLSKFMGLSSRLRSGNHSNAIDGIRQTYLKRMQSLVTTTAALPDLDMETAGSGAKQPTRQDSLWALAGEDMDLSGGAHAFRHSVVRRRHGRESSIDSEIVKLDAWVKRIENSLDCIDTARSRKWDDDLDFDIDDLDDGDALLRVLSKEDPKDMTQSLSHSIEVTVSRISAEVDAAGESTANPAYVLRIWRALDMRIRLLQARLSISPTKFSLQALHRNLARSTAQQVIDDYVRSCKSTSHVAITLWDGTPAVPVQPAPSAFKFLTSLHRAMSEVGDDLWSSGCLFELRNVVDETLGQALTDATVLKDGSGLTNGHVEAGEDDESAEPETMQASSKDRMLQSLFDQLYLKQVFHLEDTTSSNSRAIEELKKQTELDQASQQRMEKSAKEYWKRTYLLFGLLANRAKD